MGSLKTLSTAGGNLIQLLALTWANGLEGQQNSLFEDLNQADLHPAKFPDQRASPIWLCR